MQEQISENQKSDQSFEKNSSSKNSNEGKKKVMIAIKKAKTSLDKIVSMMEQEDNCFDIIQQNLAVIGLLKSANNHILENYADDCLSLMSQEGDSEKMKLFKKEVLRIINLAQNK